MYKTKDITKDQLKKVGIQNQDEILALTGSKLEPMKAWEVVKQSSENFTNSNKKALEADALLFEMVKGKTKEKLPKKMDEKIKIKEKERTRSLALLELELLIAA